ncbi:iron chelate uptake ABC transporter family permease subunit [Balneolaceae bacterium ANBcel3]|nr:iron chelate uptake ABC transporter family permease subunit [Balneolaceae bacterium ANBcel3]
MDAFWEFFSLRDPNIRYVLGGTVLLGIASGLIGTFTVLRRRALVGDAVAHAILPGVCLGFILAGGKDPLLLVAGAFVFGLLSMITMDFITRNSIISPDTSIAMVLSVFFGLGVVLLTMIQSSSFTDQSGLDDFLFGQAASMVGYDVKVFGGLSLFIILSVILVYKEFKVISFDLTYAKSIGYPVKRLELAMALLMVLIITAGIQAVGVVLMASMLIIPAAAARYWTDSLSYLLLIAAVFGAISGAAGSFISYTAPAMPTGPWMVVSAACVFFVSFFFAPGRGELSRMLESKKLSFRIRRENVLKSLYSFEEKDGKAERVRTLSELMKTQRLSKLKMKSILSYLKNKELIHVYPGPPSGFVLTENGRKEAKRLVRVHRLWEKYLNEYLQIPEDHVHDDAESMEHLITEDIEKELRASLGSPDKDPHQSQIPYDDPASKQPDRSSNRRNTK